MSDKFIGESAFFIIFNWIASLDDFELSQDDDVVILKIKNDAIGIVNYEEIFTMGVSFDELLPILYSEIILSSIWLS